MVINRSSNNFTPRVTIGDDSVTPPLNVTERSSEPSTPQTDDIYMDDGTNTGSGNPGWRRYDGAAWEDITAAASGGGTPMTFVMQSAFCTGIALINTNTLSPAYSDDFEVFIAQDDNDTIGVRDATSGGDVEARVVTTDWASATTIIGMAKIGSYLYVGMTAADSTTRVYRYAFDDLASGGTQMTLTELGTTAKPTKMICDGTNLYFNQDGGDTTANLHIFEKYTISGTAMTADSKITCGATSEFFTDAAMDSSGNFYGHSIADDLDRRHDTSGTLQATQTTIMNTTNNRLAWTLEGVVYSSGGLPTGTIFFQKLPLQP